METSATPLPGIPMLDSYEAACVLYQGEGFLPIQAQPCMITVEMRWVPQHEVRISITGTDDSPINGLRLGGRGSTLGIRLLDVKGSSNSIDAYMRSATVERWVGWLANLSVVGAAGHQVDYIGGHLINFVDTRGSVVSGSVNDVAYTWDGRTMIDIDDWRIVFDSSPCLTSIVERLKETGQYGKTHALQIRRLDKSRFRHSDAGAVMAGLHLALSFLLGRYTAPIYSGYVDANTQVWAEWGIPKTDQFARGYCGLWHPDALQKLEDLIRPSAGCLP